MPKAKQTEKRRKRKREGGIMEVMEWRRGVLKRWSGQRERREKKTRGRGMTARGGRRETVQSDESLRTVRTEILEGRRGLEVHQLSQMSTSWTLLSL